MSQSARGLFFRLFWKCSIFSYGNEGGNAPKTAYCCITTPPEKLSTTRELVFLQGNWCFVGLAVYFSLYHTSNGSLSTQNYCKIYYFFCMWCFLCIKHDTVHAGGSGNLTHSPQSKDLADLCLFHCSHVDGTESQNGLSWKAALEQGRRSSRAFSRATAPSAPACPCSSPVSAPILFLVSAGLHQGVFLLLWSLVKTGRAGSAEVSGMLNKGECHFFRLRQHWWALQS